MELFSRAMAQLVADLQPTSTSDNMLEKIMEGRSHRVSLEIIINRIRIMDKVASGRLLEEGRHSAAHDTSFLI